MKYFVNHRTATTKMKILIVPPSDHDLLPMVSLKNINMRSSLDVNICTDKKYMVKTDTAPRQKGSRYVDTHNPLIKLAPIPLS